MHARIRMIEQFADVCAASCAPGRLRHCGALILIPFRSSHLMVVAANVPAMQDSVMDPMMMAVSGL